MVTNLPDKAKSKWAEVVAARNIEDKIRLMKEFLSICPKHKGTAKLIINVKRKISSLEEELEAKKRGRKTAKDLFAVEKAGDVQIAVVGLTNVGKSSLLSALTNAKPLISDIPYTTTLPIVGAFHYEGIDFQLVELPALMEGASEGKGCGLKTMSIIRNADGLILMIDSSKNPIEQWQALTKEFENSRILIKKPKGHVEIIRKPAGVITMGGGGKLIDCSFEDVKALLTDYGFKSVFVKLIGEVSIDDVEDAVFGMSTYKPTIVLANKMDIPSSQENLNSLLQLVVGLKIIPVSCLTGMGLNSVGNALVEALELIRVYTKPPGTVKPDSKPIVLRRGATVGDVAKSIHKELFERFRYARIWSGSIKGLRVGLNYLVEDGCIVEIHSR
ncbi:50S ribosome-binding GTPase [Candidatus Bathyarchaeota archaeon]|nr:50S ribosome-binding GTPase [Candidatus Bathyarchaeota archaeon]MBS7613227.1 50S ribosome-binding GTPase [Candidatus Bathyarchaeota archaeon]